MKPRLPFGPSTVQWYKMSTFLIDYIISITPNTRFLCAVASYKGTWLKSCLYVFLQYLMNIQKRIRFDFFLFFTTQLNQ